MVDVANLMQAQSLWGDYMRTKAALDNFNNGGRIVMMQVTAGPPNENQPVPATMVPTQDIDYPPQMIEGIKAILAARAAEVLKKLTEMGVTGFEEFTQAPPEPTGAPVPPQARGKKR